MKLLLAVAVLLMSTLALGECIAFAPPRGDSTSLLARTPLATAVTLSGDFTFFESRHDGCWHVNVIAVQPHLEGGKDLGYTIAYTVTDPDEIEVAFHLFLGPDQSVFEEAMRTAAADTIRNIRFVRSLTKKK